MTFLFPIALLGLLTLAVPIILHLIKQSKVKEVEWAAMDFLKKKEVRAVNSRSLKNIPLLLTRLAILLFLVLALARPIGSFIEVGKQSPNTIFLLLDRSPEMGWRSGGGTALEAALKDVEVALLDYGGKTRVYLIDSATLEVVPVLSPKNLPLLAETKLVDTPASVPEMMSKTFNEIERGDYGRAEVWVIASDSEASWKPKSGGWDALAEVKVEGVRIRPFIASPADRDLSMAVTNMRFSQNQLSLELQIQGGNTGEVVLLEGEWDDGTKIQEEVVLSDQEESYELELLPTSADGTGYLSLPDDYNPNNNKVFLSYGPPSEVWTLLVTDNPTDIVTKNIKKSLALSSRPHQKVRTITPENVLHTDLSIFDLIVWVANGEGTESRQIIESFVNEGGVAVIFPSPRGENHALGWFLGEVQETPGGEFFSVKEWRKKDGPWRSAKNGEPLPLTHLKGVLLARSKVEGMVLASWSSGVPLLMQQYLGRGRLYTLSTLPDPRWSNMENLALHLVLLQRLLQEVTLKGGGGFLHYLESGRSPYQAQLVSQGGRTVALNRAPRSSGRAIASSEIESLLKNGEAEISRGGKRPLRPWLYPFLLVVLISIIMESLVKIVPKLKRYRKEVTSV